MFSFLTELGFQSFVIAWLVLVGLCLIEVVSLVFGHSLSGAVDHLLGLDHGDVHVDVHGHDAAHLNHGGSLLDVHAEMPTHTPGGNFFGSFYDWLNAGRVPLLILLMAALGAFSVVG